MVVGEGLVIAAALVGFFFCKPKELGIVYCNYFMLDRQWLIALLNGKRTRTGGSYPILGPCPTLCWVYSCAEYSNVQPHRIVNLKSVGVNNKSLCCNLNQDIQLIIKSGATVQYGVYIPCLK